MEKIELAETKVEYYFAIRLTTGELYWGKVIDQDKIFVVENINHKDVITTSRLHDKPVIGMKSVFIQIDTKDGRIPVKYEDMPGGSPILWISTDQITTFNALDNASKLVEALNAIDSGVLTNSKSPDIAKSPRERD